ncbi:GlxA family transcriptional regulator [Caulobacter sp.]|uniref:GlxA family transcriptional regulator n=1 Tax=Caulobacter sp. TaxID=78 RepID=UPI003BAE94EB
MRATHPPVEVGLLLYPQVQLAAVHGLTDLFSFADALTRKRLEVATPMLRLSHYVLNEAGGLARTFDSAPDIETSPSTVIVPPCHVTPASYAHTPLLAAWLRGQAEAGATLASVCGGTFLLAETGLLDGLTATTHWVFAEELATRFPNVRVDTDRLIIDHGQILTAGGMMAWADLGLTLVNRLLGPAAMVETARFMMIDPPGREQRFYSPFSPKLSHGDGAVLKVQKHLGQSPSAGLSVVALAALAGLEERTFVRRFRKATGLKPTDYQQHLRVDRAREMLESSVTPIDAIAWNVGYSDPASFRRVFVRITGLSPGDYRKRFSPKDHQPAKLRSPMAAATA